MRAPFTKLHVHLVWATWDRLPLISAALEAPLFACIAVEARKAGSEVIAIGGLEDHVHVLARLSTTTQLAQLVQRIKGGSSHLAPNLPGAPEFFRWQGGYGAFSVSSWDLGRVQRYIRRQKEHHATGRLSATLERIVD